MRLRLPFSRPPQPLQPVQALGAAEALVAHRTAWGGCEVVEADPQVETHEDVLLLPFSPDRYYDEDRAWGVYAQGGGLIEAAALRRGPSDALVGQAPALDPGVGEGAEALDGGGYVYGGPIIAHYGHFICSTLARLWWLAREGLSGRTVLFHGADPLADELERHPHIRACFARLGLSPQTARVVDRPLRVRRLTVPRPAFREQMFAHPVFRELCHSIGAPDWEPPQDRRPQPPVYLSKSKMTWGVHRVSNEAALDEALQALGVEILHPEEMSFAEQVRLFSQDRAILGTAGSAFHTSIFAPAARQLVCITQTASINSNQVLIDTLNANRAAYVYPLSGAAPERNLEGFLTATRLTNPRRLAEALVARVAR